MNRYLWKVKMIVALAVLLALCIAAGSAEEDEFDALERL